MLRQLCLLVICFVCTSVLAQDNVLELPVSINSAGNQPDNNAMLDIQSTSKGVLIPRMTTANRLAIAGGSPTEAMLVYDSDTKSFWYYDGNVWDELITNGSWAYYYLDSDGDNFGNIVAAVYTNNPLPDYVTDNTDCDDTDANILPGGIEVCNGIDDDCDGMIDEGVTTTFYLDFDNDGFGDNNATIQACSAPAGYVLDNTDCDDTSPTTYPGAMELCNGIDDDCDMMVDEGVLLTFYLDSDSDNYGDINFPTMDCSAPPGYVDNNLDCNDGDANINPEANEDCNGIDDDCNGMTDDNLMPPLNPLQSGVCSGSVMICTGVGGWVEDYAGVAGYEADEITCDGLDNDCDGMVDEMTLTDPNNCGSCGVQCSDGLDCTTDICVGGNCEYDINMGNCVIAGVCYVDGEPNPVAECEECNSSVSQTSFTPVTDGTPCDGGNGICDSGTCIPI